MKANVARKRLPAYGRELLAKRRAGVVPTNSIFVVDDFKRGPPYQWRAVVNAGMDPLAMDFSFVAGLEVMIIAENEDRLDQIAAGVMSYRPSRVIGACADPPRIVKYLAPPME